MTEKTKVGIATHRELRERALQIARGKRRRRPSEPKIWFTSLESLAKVLSEPNRRLRRSGSDTQCHGARGGVAVSGATCASVHLLSV